MLFIAATGRELCGFAGVTCGIGPVDAAARTAAALLRDRPEAVINIGLAGARGFREPEVILGSEALYCDTDSRLVADRAVPDRALLARMREALPHAHVRPVGTSARVNGTTGCEVEAMEGFAVLRACELAGVPAVELRVTCNEIEEPDRAKWRFEDALTLLAQTLERLHA